MTAANHYVTISWTQVALFLTCAKLHSPVLTAQEKALASRAACYPISRVECKSFVIPAGTQSCPLDTVYAGQIPRRLFMMFVDNSAEHGSWQSNPFQFKHFKVNYISCLINGEQYPAIPLNPDFEKEDYWREYYQAQAVVERN